jgi:hypothetical protein
VSRRRKAKPKRRSATPRAKAKSGRKAAKRPAAKTRVRQTPKAKTAKRPAAKRAPTKRRAIPPPPATTAPAAALSYATLERLLTEARRRTGAEAGTIYLRDEDGLRFAIVQNDLLEQRVGRAAFEQRLRGEHLPMDRVSIASWVALTKTSVNLPLAQDTPLDRPYAVDRTIDRRLEYVTRSVLAVPLRTSVGEILGVLQLINALDRRGRVVSFDRTDELAVAAVVDAALPRAGVGV